MNTLTDTLIPGNHGKIFGTNAIKDLDLLFNVSRIEQRIGRCHRYGQKHDVVVINFINENNEADKRVYELLDQKFNLFKGVLQFCFKKSTC